MAIVIVEKKEIPDAETHFDVSCFACRSRISFELKDSRIGYSFGSPDYAEIDCPSCGGPIKVGLTNAQAAMAWRDRKVLKKA